MGRLRIAGPLLLDPLAFSACQKTLHDYGRDHPDCEMVVVIQDRGQGLELEAQFKSEFEDDLHEYLIEDLMDAGFLQAHPIEIPPDFLVPIWTAEFLRAGA